MTEDLINMILYIHENHLRFLLIESWQIAEKSKTWIVAKVSGILAALL